MHSPALRIIKQEVEAMKITYTDDEARQKFHEVLQHVREGNIVIVTCGGDPMAEIRLIEQEEESMTNEEWLAELERRGELVPAKEHWNPPKGIRVKGALERFLKERG